MQMLFFALAAACMAVIIALHVLSAVFSDKRSAVLNFINIALHIVLVFALLLAGAELELVALAFMVSLLVYVLVFWIKRKRGESEGKE